MRRSRKKWYLIIKTQPNNSRHLYIQFKSTSKNKEFDFAAIMLHKTHKCVGELDVDVLAGLKKPGYYRILGFANQGALADYYPMCFSEIQIGTAMFTLTLSS